MTDPNESMIKRIQGLLAKAEDTGVTEAERDLYTAKATELMMKYSIDTAMLHSAEKPESISRKHLKLDFIPAAYTHEYAVLGASIAPYLNCRGIRATLPKRTDLFIIGHDSDLESLEMLYWSLVRQCMFSLISWYKSFDTKRYMFGMSPQDKMAAKKSFVVGFINGATMKLESVRTQVIKDVGHGAEIVLVGKQKAIDSWIDENMKLSKGRHRRYVPDGRNAGFQAGYDADIGQPQMGLNRRAIGTS